MQPSFLRVDIQHPLPGDLDPFCRDDMKEKTKRFSRLQTDKRQREEEENLRERICIRQNGP